MTNNIIQPGVARIESVKLFDAHLDKYNAIQEGWSTRLRDSHRAMFIKLVDLLDAKFREQNRVFGKQSIVNPNFGIALTESSFIISKHLKCAPSTVRLRLNRLMDSGVILRIDSHGLSHAPDIILNPRYLKIDSIFELFSSGTIPGGYLPQNVSSAEYCIGKKENNIINTNCSESESDFKAAVNGMLEGLSLSDAEANALLPSGNCAESVALLREGRQEPLQEPRDMPNLSQRAQTFKEKMETSEERFRAKIYQYALLFMSLAANKYFFWKDRKDGCKLYAPAFDKAVTYIGQYYFSHCKTEAELQRTFNLYEQRLQLVSSYLKRKERECQWPEQYFDVNNKDGFIKTKHWLKKIQLYTAFKEHSKQRKSDTDRLIQAVNRVKADHSCYTKTKNYIKSRAPHLIRQFEDMIQQNDKDVA